MLGLTISSKFDWGSFIISIAKTASKKIGTLICSMQFLSMVALYLYKSTIRPHLRYCCQVWAGAPRCYLELLYKLQRRLCRTVGLSLATSLGYLFLKGGLLVILINCMIFLSPFPDVTRMFMSTVPFIAQLGSGILCLENAFP